MQPTIGRIVHYNSSQGAAAAIIIDVHPYEMVDLQVMHRDGSIDHAMYVKRGDDMGQWQWPPRA